MAPQDVRLLHSGSRDYVDGQYQTLFTAFLLLTAGRLVSREDGTTSWQCLIILYGDKMRSEAGSKRSACS